MMDDIQVTPLSLDNFEYVRDFVAKEAAIILEKGKEYLVETRLASIATRNGCASVDALIDFVRTDGPESASIRSSIIDALTTNETLFFRDLNPFDALRDQVIPKFIEKNPGQKFSLWSAASSSGQEAYSVAMLLAEHFPQLQSRIIGSDLSPTMVARAKAGIYQQLEVNRGLPAKLLVKYFKRNSEGWQIDEAMRRRCEFNVLNLARTWPPQSNYHVVMLRNVMIYFNNETRKDILRQVRRVLAPGGYLVLGGAETPVMIDPAFKPVTLGRATFYQLE